MTSLRNTACFPRKSASLAFATERSGMPPKTKRNLRLVKNCVKAREVRLTRIYYVGTSGTAASAMSTDEETSLALLAEMTENAMDTDDKAVNQSFDMNESVMHLSMVCPTPPVWGTCRGIVGDSTSITRPMGGDLLGMCS